eukprot:14224332-Alexandrium_andersonii.AAC.1
MCIRDSPNSACCRLELQHPVVGGVHLPQQCLVLGLGCLAIPDNRLGRARSQGKATASETNGSNIFNIQHQGAEGKRRPRPGPQGHLRQWSGGGGRAALTAR